MGALDVFDEIDLEPPTPKAGDVQHSIKKAFKRNAALDAEDLSVSTDNGTVTIDGTVSSWAQHDEAIDAAWAAPGVTSVRRPHDRLVLTTHRTGAGGNLIAARALLSERAASRKK